MASVAIAVSAMLLLGGCSSGTGATAPSTAASAPASESPSPSVPAPSPTPTPAQTPTIDVPVTSADLGDNVVAPTVVPVRVEVASLGVDMPIIPEGIDRNGNLALPPDPAIASWYEFGPSPWSAGGSTVIAAHVDSSDYSIGPFARLADVAPGTPVRVSAADGRVVDYVVQDVTMIEKVGVDWATVFDRTGPGRLALITCGGEFNYQTGHYLSNVIVTAVPAA